mmetsp:Transcript_39244/g.59302  ORF Transcript_39244/g.59302 Transcript_39244/m.59302 type:complete len:180 (+) Transcript_39244:3-542(+)
MLDATLWGILFPADPDPDHTAELNFCSYNEHAFNFVLICVEIVVNSIEIRLHDLALALLWPMAYSVWTMIRIAANPDTRICLTQHPKQCDTRGQDKYLVWPYFFMDTSKSLVVVWLLILVFIFSLAFLLMLTLNRYVKRKRAQTLEAPEMTEAFHGARAEAPITTSTTATTPVTTPCEA